MPTKNEQNKARGGKEELKKARRSLSLGRFDLCETRGGVKKSARRAEKNTHKETNKLKRKGKKTRRDEETFSTPKELAGILRPQILFARRNGKKKTRALVVFFFFAMFVLTFSLCYRPYVEGKRAPCFPFFPGLVSFVA